MCLTCRIGFRKTEDGGCVPCGDNCNHCNDKRCVVCAETFSYDLSKYTCNKCRIKNCVNCSSKDVCQECKPGMYFNREKKICEECPGNCLNCSDNGKNCHSCPINFYTLEEEIITHKKSSGENLVLPNLLSMIFGGLMMKNPQFNITEVKMISKCYEKCPEKF